MRKTLANWESALTAECTENTEGMGRLPLEKTCWWFSVAFVASVVNPDLWCSP